MNRIRCFMLERTMLCRQWLRVYESSGPCPNNSYHEAMVPLPDGQVVEYETPNYTAVRRVEDKDDTFGAYPTQCSCGHVFGPKAERHVFYRQLWKTETGELTTLEDAPVGAMWFAWWERYRIGPDGKSLNVKTPGGEWCIDARCSNCAMPQEKVHKCWVRHGEAPNITVDKQGYTCGAGGGSIAFPTYHGFLRNGYLEQC